MRWPIISAEDVSSKLRNDGPIDYVVNFSCHHIQNKWCRFLYLLEHRTSIADIFNIAFDLCEWQCREFQLENFQRENCWCLFDSSKFIDRKSRANFASYSRFFISSFAPSTRQCFMWTIVFYRKNDSCNKNVPKTDVVNISSIWNSRNNGLYVLHWYLFSDNSKKIKANLEQNRCDEKFK